MQVSERVEVVRDSFYALPRRRFASAAGAVLLRVHVPAVFSARGMTAAAGLGLGGLCLLAILLLYQSIGAPFAVLDTRIRAIAPEAEIVRSRMGTWLPDDLYRRLPTPEALVPVSGGFAELTSTSTSEGALVLGGDCRIERLVGEFGCTEMMGHLDTSAATPGVFITAKLANSLGVANRDVVTFPGGQQAQVIETIDDPRLESLNNGFVVAGETTNVAALFGHPGQLAAIYAPQPDPAFAARVNAELGDRLSVSRPSGQTRYMVPVIEQVRRFLLIGGIAAGLTGVFLAGSTLVLQNANRRRTMATLDAIGMNSTQVVAGHMCEGVMLGIAGLLLAIPGGVLVGWLLVHGYATSLLHGTGVHVSYQIPWGTIGTIAVSMMVLGCIATLPTVLKVLRRDTSEVVSGQERPESGRDVRIVWALLPLAGWIGSLVLMRGAGNGRLSVEVLQGATALYSVSTMTLTILLAPRLARLVPSLPSKWSWAPMLIRSSLTRSPIRTGFTVTIIALGVSLTFGITTVLGSVKAAIPQGVHDWLADDGLLLVGRAVGEPTAPALSPEFLESVRTRPGVSDVTPMTNLVVDNHYSVFGVPSRSRVADRIITDTGLDRQGFQDALANGEVVLGRLAANSAGVGPGDRLTLPSTAGPIELKVAAVGVPALADETGLGRVIEVDYDLAMRLWGASATSAFIEPAKGIAADTLAQGLPRTGRVQLYERDRLLSDARSFVDRLYTPFILVGRLALVIALAGVLTLLLLGLLARKQERAALHAVGMTPSQETVTIFGDAFVLSGLGAVFGIAGGVVFAWGVLLASPLLLATSPPLRLDLTTVAKSLGLSVLVCALGAALPAWHMRRLGVPLPQEE